MGTADRERGGGEEGRDPQKRWGEEKKKKNAREFHLQSGFFVPPTACTKPERGLPPSSPAGVLSQVMQLRLKHDGTVKVHQYSKKKKKEKKRNMKTKNPGSV